MFSEEYLNTGLFVARSFDGENHRFVYNKDTDQFYSIEDEKLIKTFVIKPNPWIHYQDGHFKIYSVCKNRSIIQDYIIDPSIFYDLVSSGKVMYSKLAADLYGLPIEYACDREYHKRDYKTSKNKELVLSNLRRGKFN